MRAPLKTVAGNLENQDRAAIIESRAGLVLVVLATDRLLKYANSDRIVATCRDHADQAEAAQQLIEFVRYPSGALPDDVTVILGDLSGIDSR